jgi:MFS family permease
MAGSMAVASRGERHTGRAADSIEGRSSWVAAALTTAILAIAYGAPLLIVVGLKPIAASLGTDRSVVALAGALVWVGTGMGGIVMGWVADRIGVRPTVMFGALMAALGLAVSSIGQGLGAVSRTRDPDRPSR